MTPRLNVLAGRLLVGLIPALATKRGRRVGGAVQHSKRMQIFTAAWRKVADFSR
jgi:hypothetical protein